MRHRASALSVVGLALASCSSIAGSTSRPPVFDGGAPDVPAPVDVPPVVDVPPSECPLGCPAGRPICLHGGTCVGVVDVAMSEDATCALLTDTTVWCWGDNLWGDVGDGTTMFRQTPAPVAGLRDVADLTSSEGTMFAVMADGTVRRWGAVWTDGDPSPALTPVVIDGFTSVRSLSASNARICAALTDGTVRCMGNNAAGQIDRNDSRTWVPSPVAVSGLRDIVAVTTRDEAPCALDVRGAVWCRGVRGVGDDTDGAVPVVGGVDAVAIATTTVGGQTCVAVRGGPLRCGRLVSTVGGSPPLQVTDVPGVSDVVQLDSWFTTCGVRGDHTVWCSQPAFTGTLSGVAQVALGFWNGCARMLDGSLRCWQTTDDANGGAVLGSPVPVAW